MRSLPIYSTEITAGSLKVTESRVIAGLLLDKVDHAAWKSALVKENVLQTRSPQTAYRLAQLIRNRLETMPPDLWKLVRDGNKLVATHACLAATVKRNAIVADFFRFVVHEQFRLYEDKLTNRDWIDFIYDCQCRVPNLPQWRENTIIRMRSSVFQILEQAGYIDNTVSRKLRYVYIADEVLQFLCENKEQTVLHCIQLK
ncbi:MAG: DUF1819 family protein [Planctomycetaceae bacterium]|jgi:hypothetical protein|nr:DUF1819 family protein [Planctomycetaceae bacterium]